jgi:hypothetical protein
MAQVDLEAIADEGKTKAARAVEYVRTIQVDPPKFSLLTGLIFCVIWMVITFGYGWHKAHERDKWWRAEIASKSVAVKTAITKANAELPDDEILKTLGDSDAALRKAELALTAKPAPATDTCPIVPVICLR